MERAQQIDRRIRVLHHPHRRVGIGRRRKQPQRGAGDRRDQTAHSHFHEPPPAIAPARWRTIPLPSLSDSYLGRYCVATPELGATRQTTLPTSSATSSAPLASIATPTGRP